MDDAVEVQGLDSLWPSDPYSGRPRAWRPRGPGMGPEPEMLRLRLRHKSHEFEAIIAYSAEGHRQIRELDEKQRDELDEWVKTTPGWWVRVSGPGGGLFSSPYATLEAAILGAMSIPHVSLERMYWKEGDEATGVKEDRLVKRGE